jgi:LysR family transcriptional activator of nhaA
MATLRLLAREGEGLALVPTVVVRDELESGELVEVQAIPQLRETFYAITPTRRLPNKIVEEMVTRMRPAAGRTASA